MRKQNLVFMLLILLGVVDIALAQKGNYQEIKDIKHIDSKGIFSAFDDDGNLCICYQNDLLVYSKIYNKQGEIINTHVINSNPSSLLGVVSNNNRFHVYLNYSYDDTVDKLMLVSLNKDDKGIEVHPQIEIITGKKEKYITHFFDENKLFVLTAYKKSSDIIVKKISCDNTLKMDTIPTAIDRVYKSFASQPFVKIDDKFLYDLFKGKPQQKIYFSDSKIYLMIDRQSYSNQNGDVYTEILTIDTITKKSEHYKVHDDNTLKNNKCISFLVDQSLFRFSVAKQEINLSIYSKDGFKLIKQHKYSKKDPFDLSDKGVFKERAYGGASEISGSTPLLSGDVIKKMRNGRLSILGKKISNSAIKLQIGLINDPAPYNRITAEPNQGSIPVPLAGGGMVSISKSALAGNKSKTYFETTLNLSNFEKINEMFFPFDEIAKYISDKISSGVSIGYFSLSRTKDGKDYLIFHDMASNSIKVVPTN